MKLSSKSSTSSLGFGMPMVSSSHTYIKGKSLSRVVVDLESTELPNCYCSDDPETAPATLLSDSFEVVATSSFSGG